MFQHVIRPALLREGGRESFSRFSVDLVDGLSAKKTPDPFIHSKLVDLALIALHLTGE